MFCLENRGETLFFMSIHFDQTITIFMSYFLRFGALNVFTGDCFVIRISKITYSKQKQKTNKQTNKQTNKNGMFHSFLYFFTTFPTACFPLSFVHGNVETARRMDKITHPQVNDS